MHAHRRYTHPFTRMDSHWHAELYSYPHCAKHLMWLQLHGMSTPRMPEHMFRQMATLPPPRCHTPRGHAAWARMKVQFANAMHRTQITKHTGTHTHPWRVPLQIKIYFTNVPRPCVLSICVYLAAAMPTVLPDRDTKCMRNTVIDCGALTKWVRHSNEMIDKEQLTWQVIA